MTLDEMYECLKRNPPSRESDTHYPYPFHVISTGSIGANGSTVSGPDLTREEADEIAEQIARLMNLEK